MFVDTTGRVDLGVKASWLPWLAMLTTAAGCALSEEGLRARAAFDMKCNENALEVVEIDDRTRGVRGCGQQATYVSTCKPGSVESGCTWVLNSDSTAAARKSREP